MCEHPVPRTAKFPAVVIALFSPELQVYHVEDCHFKANLFPSVDLGSANSSWCGPRLPRSADDYTQMQPKLKPCIVVRCCDKANMSESPVYWKPHQGPCCREGPPAKTPLPGCTLLLGAWELLNSADPFISGKIGAPLHNLP